jgi:hypothetical protein
MHLKILIRILLFTGQRLSGQKEVPTDLAATLSAAQKANDQDIAGDDADSDED